MMELLDFGKHTPFIAASYSVSIIVIALMLWRRWRKLTEALEKERHRQQNFN